LHGFEWVSCEALLDGACERIVELREQPAGSRERELIVTHGIIGMVP
jgi:hypothetical protein